MLMLASTVAHAQVFVLQRLSHRLSRNDETIDGACCISVASFCFLVVALLRIGAECYIVNIDVFAVRLSAKD